MHQCYLEAARNYQLKSSIKLDCVLTAQYTDMSKANPERHIGLPFYIPFDF